MAALALVARRLVYVLGAAAIVLLALVPPQCIPSQIACFYEAHAPRITYFEQQQRHGVYGVTTTVDTPLLAVEILAAALVTAMLARALK